jgi:hypothetical protein
VRDAVVGSVGKSVLSATPARTPTRRGRDVLAVDLDPNPGLAYSLGLPPSDAGLPPETTVEIKGELYGWGSAPELDLATGAMTLSRLAPDGVRYLSPGKIEGKTVNKNEVKRCPGTVRLLVDQAPRRGAPTPRRVSRSFSMAGARACLLAVLAVGAAACGPPASTASPAGPAGSSTSAAPSGAPSTAASRPRAAARWETVVTLSGSGVQQTESFTILPEAIQWRVRWTCDGTQPFRLTTTPGPRRPGPIADETCPAGVSFAIHTGSIRLGVDTPGPWKAIVDQQIDMPLDEAPLAEMATATVAGEGDFYGLDRTGRGTARLFVGADGRRFLRLEGFETEANTDLVVWLTDSARPADSATAFAARRVVLGNLRSTVGDQNYEIPADAAIDIRSVVIWCEPVAIAYTAAALGPSS